MRSGWGSTLSSRYGTGAGGSSTVAGVSITFPVRCARSLENLANVGPRGQAGQAEAFRDENLTCWGDVKFASDYQSVFIHQCTSTLPVQRVVELVAFVDCGIGWPSYGPFWPQLGFPKPVSSDEIAAVPRMVSLLLDQTWVGGSGVDGMTEAMS